MSNNKGKYPYTPGQIAEWLDGRYDEKSGKWWLGWNSPEGPELMGEKPFNFYLPEHNWRVQDVVEKLAIEKGCRVETTTYQQPSNGCDYFELSIEKGVSALTIIFECQRKLKDKGRAYVEALAELKRPEKGTEDV